MNSPTNRSRLASRAAVVLLAVGVLIGVLAYAFRDDPEPRAAVSPGAADARTTGPTGAEDKTATPRERHFPGPAKDPRTGRNYCTTVTLLGRYAETDYGLDATGKVVSGRDFDRRLVVIGGTYRRLADQAGDVAAVRGTAPSWLALARATERAEATLRSVGLQVQSQPMIVDLARLARSSRTLLPRATSGLQQACGIDPAHLGG